MGRAIVDEDKLTAIGDSLRKKNGTNTLYTLDEMPDVIDGIGGGITSLYKTDTISGCFLTYGKNSVAKVNSDNFYFLPCSQNKQLITPFAYSYNKSRVIIRFKYIGGYSSNNRGLISSISYSDNFKFIPSILISASDNCVKLNINDKDVITNNSINTNTWYVVVYYYDSSLGLNFLSLYDDNLNWIETISMSQVMQTSASAIGFGGWRSNSNDKYYGEIDLSCTSIEIDGTVVWGNLPSIYNDLGMVSDDILTNPDNYQEVEYLESTGTQYFYSDVYMTPQSRVVVDMQFTSNSPTQQRVFGTQYDSAYYSTYDVYINGNTQWATAHKDGTGDWTSTNVSANTNRHIFDYYANHYFKIDDGVVYSGTFANTTTHNSYYPITFGRHSPYTSSGSAVFSKAKWYAIQVYGENGIERNYKPSRHKIISNLCGMYDDINNILMNNAGANEFNVGPDV